VATANTVMFAGIFPIMFLSGIFVPVNGLPGAVRWIGEWSPIAAMAQAVRDLFHNAAPPPPGAWSLQHPVVYVLLVSVAITLVFAPLAVRRFRVR
jgi:ABC-2 type transport system permease protein